MRHLLLTLALFALAAGINTGSVALEQQRQWLTKPFGSRAWAVHMVLITPGWLAFLAFDAQLNYQFQWPLPTVLRPLGAVLVAAALILFAMSFWQLGMRQTFNGHFFGWKASKPLSSGAFRWLKNPMYDSFCLGFIGGALVLTNGAYLVLAVASYLFLNRFEAGVENRPFTEVPVVGVPLVP